MDQLNNSTGTHQHISSIIFLKNSLRPPYNIFNIQTVVTSDWDINM